MPLPRPTEPPAPGARRRDALRNEAQIVAAAMRLLADDPEATMQDVAAAAGVGRATVYRHFPTREALTEAIGLSAIDELGAALAAGRLEDGDPIAALARGLEAIFTVGERYRVVMQAGGAAPRKGPRMEAAFRPMREVIERAQREGALIADPSPEWVVTAVGALIAAAFKQLASGAISRDDAPRLVMETMLRGFGTARGGAPA